MLYFGDFLLPPTAGEKREADVKRVKQLALTSALALPLILTLAFAGPLTAPAGAQGGLKMVGPQNPILIDTNGDGRPTPGVDAPANPQLSGNTLNLTTLFSCNSQNNTQIILGGLDSSGHFRTATRSNNGRSQVLSISGVTGDSAISFGYSETDTRGQRAAGLGQLIDSNGDGAADTIAAHGNLHVVSSLVFSSDGQYVSIPVAQAALFGATTSRCGLGAVPQIWVPLADTNGDGRGDTIILDLNGDGIPDSQFYRSPRLAAVGVPTTNNVGLSILTLLLGGVGVWFLGRRRLTGLDPQARS